MKNDIQNYRKKYMERMDIQRKKQITKEQKEKEMIKEWDKVGYGEGKKHRERKIYSERVIER